jgi:hypothetical protein
MVMNAYFIKLYLPQPTDILGAAAQGWKTVLVTKDGLFSGFDTISFCEGSRIFANWRLGRINP